MAEGWHQACLTHLLVPRKGHLRIKILHKPTVKSIDGLHLEQFEPGLQYEVGNTLGAVMLAEGWARLVRSEEPAMVIPLADIAKIAPAPTSVAADRPRRPRARKKR
jgi:hypothetical protein